MDGTSSVSPSRLATIVAPMLFVVAVLIFIVGYYAWHGKGGRDDGQEKQNSEEISESGFAAIDLNLGLIGTSSPFTQPLSIASPQGSQSITGSWPSMSGSVKQLPDDLEVKLLGCIVGRGAFSLVEEGLLTDPNGRCEKVVVKRLGGWVTNAVDKAVEAMRNELMVLEHVPVHKNIIRCYGGRLPPMDTSYTEGEPVADVYIVEEKMETNLSTLIHGAGDSVNGSHRSGRRGPDLVFSHLLKIFTGINDGLEHLHRHRIVHYDLKPANVLLDSLLLAGHCAHSGNCWTLPQEAYMRLVGV
eukprot:evm.model.scf_1161.6 EVM.evm.TU.scf_1161.6   scf_1161:45918-48339(-)